MIRDDEIEVIRDLVRSHQWLAADLRRNGEDVAVEQECQLLYKSGCEVTNLLYVSRKRMNRWLDEEAPDLLHLHKRHFPASRSIIRAAKRKGLPVVLTLYDVRLSPVQTFWLSMVRWLGRGYGTIRSPAGKSGRLSSLSERSFPPRRSKRSKHFSADTGTFRGAARRAPNISRSIGDAYAYSFGPAGDSIVKFRIFSS